MVAVAGCSHSAAPSPGPTTSTAGPTDHGGATRGKTDWIISSAAIGLLRTGGLSNRDIDELFDNPQTFVIETGSARAGTTLPRAVPVETVTSYVALKKILTSGTLPPGTKGILFDEEDWRFTPSGEIDHPIRYAARAQALAHRYGLTFIFTPGTDLVDAVAGSPSGTDPFQRYLTLGLASQGARVSDVFEIQAQQAEATPDFLPFAATATAQARAANPDARVLLGMGTEPGGRPVTIRDLLADYRMTRPLVDGYWFNIPQAGPTCPACGTGQPVVAVHFFRYLVALMHR